MDKLQLAEAIIDFSTQYDILRNSDSMIAESIGHQLDNIWFVEHLIHEIIYKVNYTKYVDKKQLKEILIELEKIRLDLEYGN